MTHFGLAEPEFFKQISNTSICTWFYILFIVNAVFAFVAIIFVAYMSLAIKMPAAYKLVYIVMYSLAVAVPVINSTFFYIMCDRALPPSQKYA
jgi:hypothetical protein